MEENRKVVFYNGSLRIGGIERILIEVLKNIDKKKLDISLVIEDGIISENVFEKDIPAEIDLSYLKSEETILRTRELRKKRKNLFYKYLYNMAMAKERRIKEREFLKLSSEKKPKVIVDFDMGLSKLIHKVDNDIVKIAWVHASIKNWYSKASKIKRLGERLKNYNYIVAICDDMKEELIELFPHLEDKILRIYNPFDFERIRRMAEEKIEVKEEKALFDSPYIISIMRLTTKQKDFLTLLRAYKKLIEDGKNEKLLIFGNGPDKDKIEEEIVRLDLEGKAILMGGVENPYPWLKKAKLFVHSSKYEGLPTVLIEAMILGKGVVSSDCPTGPREILRDGSCGVLYPIGDFDKMYKEIKMMLENEGYLDNFLESSHKRIEEFKKETVLEEYKKLILKGKCKEK
ncbi:glycosyl transferase [Propionigenium maris DSM 9537]|uniref:Glycosyl transferase n=1 Tax=Propionigenium maris DSM 9537 TaxID=1123000 RepID=A0A9W6GK90_9FUSO|nr:glycosyltransferase [Propionigenium maris]GLI55167.1 glycosyl transferase [Propionigenium maris DSM 9537]